MTVLHPAELTAAEKIYARKLMTLYAEPLGKLSEKAVADLTAYNTFFEKEQLEAYLSEGFRRLLPPEEKLKQTPGGLRRTADYAAQCVGREILAQENLCPRVTAGNTILYTSADLVQAENDIVDTARRMSSRHFSFFPKGSDLMDLAEDFGVFWGGAQGYSSSRELNAALASILEPSDLRVINGPPGAGKSALCAGVAYCILAHSDEPPSFITTSPSDKAAAAIQADVQFAASALDDKWPEQSQVEGYSLHDLVDRLNDGMVKPGTVIIVDEAGLMGTRDMARFIKAADQARAKLFLLGDNRQIPPVPAGNGFDLILSHVPEVPCCSVSRILRQTTPGEAKASAWIRDGKAGKALDFYDRQRYADGAKALNFYPDGEEVFDRLTADFVAFTTSEEASSRSSVVLAVDEPSADMLNARLREGLKKAGVIRKTQQFLMPDGRRRELGLGDAVMFMGKMETRCGASLETVNAGTTARVVDIRDGNVGLMLDGRKQRVYIGAPEVASLRSSWALPLYVAQGVSRSRAFLAVNRKGALDLANGLVAFTRHQEQMSAYISRKAYPDAQALAAEMSVFSTRKPVIRDYAALTPAGQETPLSAVVTRSLSRGRPE